MTGTISSAKRPSSVAATARRLEWYDQSSDSSRVMPHSLAVFSPTVMSMFMLGASGVSGWLGGMNCFMSPKGKGDFSKRSGERVMDSMPPATTASAMPERMLAAALLHGHHPGGALALHGAARRVGRQAERVGDVAGRAAAALEDLAEDQVVDVVRGRGPEAASDAGHGLHADVQQGQPGQAAAGAPDRGADGGDDDGIVASVMGCAS